MATIFEASYLNPMGWTVRVHNNEIGGLGKMSARFFPHERILLGVCTLRKLLLPRRTENQPGKVRARVCVSMQVILMYGTRTAAVAVHVRANSTESHHRGALRCARQVHIYDLSKIDPLLQ